MKHVATDELKAITENHLLWLMGDPKGLRANLSSADLSEADLSGADLSNADLREANLSGADLGGADLREANLGGADLRYTNLRGADLSGADLRSADLSGTDLSYANLSGADLIYTILGQYTLFVGKEQTRIGYLRKPNTFWLFATNEDVRGFSVDAADWWIEWREIVVALIMKVQSTPIVHK